MGVSRRGGIDLFRFDHAIIAVHDLEQAIADYRALGFNAFFGGQHADGKTHNGLIVFADGGYLELLAPTHPALLADMAAVESGSFLHFVARGDGLSGFALLVEDVDAAAAGMREGGLSITGPTANSRLRPDGEKIAWHIISIDDSRTPFFIRDETPRVLRVPDDVDRMTHPNGATGVAGIVVAVHDLQQGIERYRAILGDEPTETHGKESATFVLDGFSLKLAAPTNSDDPLNGYLRQRGEVPYQIRLIAGGDSGLLDVEKAHNARIVLGDG